MLANVTFESALNHCRESVLTNLAEASDPAGKQAYRNALRSLYRDEAEARHLKRLIVQSRRASSEQGECAWN